MSNYDKGARGERELIGILEDNGFACLRAPASGAGTERELPDVIAGDGDVFFVFEVKRWDNKDYGYLSKKEFGDLEFFAESFGAKARAAIRFDHCDWGFFQREELKETKKNLRCDNFKTSEEVTRVEDICNRKKRLKN